MIQVSSPRQFSEHDLIAYFSGKDYDDAIRLANEWAQRVGAHITSYYPQKAFDKSILVGYRVKTIEDIVK